MGGSPETTAHLLSPRSGTWASPASSHGLVQRGGKEMWWRVRLPWGHLAGPTGTLGPSPPRTSGGQYRRGRPGQKGSFWQTPAECQLLLPCESPWLPQLPEQLPPVTPTPCSDWLSFSLVPSSICPFPLPFSFLFSPLEILSEGPMTGNTVVQKMLKRAQKGLEWDGGNEKRNMVSCI